MLSPGLSQRIPDRPRIEDASPPPGIQRQQAALVRADERVEAIRASESSAAARPTEELSASDKEEVQRLKNRDAEVRAHEQAHAAAGGSHAGAPSYEFETGPDGRRYAVGGEVSIDASEISGDPKASIAKMQQVVRAATAPASPSGQDRKVAAKARAKMAKLQAEMTQEAARAQSPGAPQGNEAAEAGDTEPNKGGPPGAARAQRSYAQTNAAPAESSLDITACGKCGGGH
ncbi:MAG: putative metalloprotease CJM1_0395 family protein [Polyangiales bacterium]